MVVNNTTPPLSLNVVFLVMYIWAISSGFLPSRTAFLASLSLKQTFSSSSALCFLQLLFVTSLMDQIVASLTIFPSLLEDTQAADATPCMQAYLAICGNIRHVALFIRSTTLFVLQCSFSYGTIGFSNSR